MSKREDIVDGKLSSGLKYGLVYTEVLGWIDLGHAQGNDIRKLLRDFAVGESSGKKEYNVSYSQSMVDPTRSIKMGKFLTWTIKRGRTYNEQLSIALAMMMILAGKFEGLQSSFFIRLFTDSGFSGEDLISDLLGFYRVVAIYNPFDLLRPVSREDALTRWDYYGKIGNWKSDDFRPWLFPDPERFPDAKPRKGYLPYFMRTVTPWHDFRSGIVKINTMNGNYIDRAKGGSLPYA
ncbi:TPA: hypothetical protein JD203_10640 [Cronobacter sakazakii]|uniref:hypothetical protein n=2 Tax=Cronobacter sakazakii TaxID=28141 RepID=UPI0004A94956|nr:hypothetical protein [Cronobacter sakazakii]EGT4354494.1 hypothetical protein [Cronobacter sakazakii]EGT5205994.1 hypothetical protein [Cronobacter sakazakii]EGT5653550.1 hypothetical protein [Cronobacter sakazakii]EGT5747991.1 hypothetical protein [Cronobacter sakazakii]EGT5753153.1 hypothetical protein [Cronobacter sakazakii]